MSAGEILDRAARLGVVITLGPTSIRYRGDEDAVALILPDLRSNALSIAALLHEREPIPCASDAVIAAQTLLGVGKRPLESAGSCAIFHGAHAGDCRCCGISRLEHLGHSPTRPT